MHAAWICDDQKPEQAASCRIKTIELSLHARTIGKPFSNEIGVEEAVLVDLYRRTGQFEQVEPICMLGLTKRPEELVEQALHYQMVLASNQDDSRHTIGEAAEYGKKS